MLRASLSRRLPTEIRGELRCGPGRRALAQPDPAAKPEAILSKLADRREELSRTKQSAEPELHGRLVRGRFFQAWWDADQRL